jgi:glycosyltransferase involved in cell wall biosynthesis
MTNGCMSTPTSLIPQTGKKRMTVSIDCRMLDASGVGVYIRGALPYLLDSTHSFVLIGDPEKLLPLAGKRRNVKIIDCRIRPFSIEELFFFPGSLKRRINKTVRFFSPYFNIPGGIRIPVFTTIHDIIFPDMPELTTKIGLMARMWFYHRAFRRSRHIFTVSEFSRSRILFYSRGRVPVTVTYSAIQPLFLEPAAGIVKTDTILFIGNIKKHKGLQTLLAAFTEAATAGLPHKLIIVGSKDNFRSVDTDIPALIAGLDPERVEFTGAVSNEKLKALLSGAALLVQPSLYEGFCLPPLEAMVCGTQALLSGIPVLREIYKDYPVTFFEPGNIRDLKEKLMRLLHGKKPERVSLSEEQKNRYTFAKTASLILKELTGC